MKTIFFFFATVSLLTLQSCQSDQRTDQHTNEEQTEDANNSAPNTQQESPTKMIEQLVGDWENTAGGQDGDMQRIRFTSEARYILYSGNQKIDSGAYRMNEQLRNLYLESEINKSPREFEVQLSDQQLTMKPKQQNAQGGETMTYRRR